MSDSRVARRGNLTTTGIILKRGKEVMEGANSRVSRRFILKGALIGGVVMPLLAACGGGEAPASPAAGSAAPAPTTAPAASSSGAATPTAAAASQAAPAAAAPASGQKVTIRAHMVKKSDVSDWIDAGLKANIDGFKDKNPNITVTLETIPGWTAEYIPKILSMVSAGQIGDAVWYPPRHRSAIAWGEQYNVVRDLNPLAKAANYDMNQFFKGSLDANSWNGKLYWMDYIGEPVCPLIAYNKTAVTKMGVGEPKDTWTFDDLTTWAKSLTKDGTFGYYRADAGDDSFGSAPFYRQFGVDFVDNTGKKSQLLANKEGFVAALKYRYDLVNTWKVSPSPAAGTINVTELIGSQKLIAGDVWPFRIQGYPDAFKDFEWGFVLRPVVKSGDKPRSMLNEHVFGITQASKSPDAAFTFLTWICGKEMNVQGIVQGAKGSIARQDFWEDQRIYDKYPVYKKLQPVMQNIEPDYFVGNFRGEEFDQAFAQAYDLMELGKAQPDATADQIQKLVQAVLDKEPA
ncbi:MAG TPA: extracellular solute-binding protein [Chloroflexota bacterium]|nr:extracellular solute-binding protein [Chloroflexota bacterium]